MHSCKPTIGNMVHFLPTSPPSCTAGDRKLSYEWMSDLPLFAADVVLLPTTRFGVVLLMNADTRLEPGRNHAIADGVTRLLLGGQPPAPLGSRAWMVYLVLVGVVAIQVAGMAWSLIILRRWRTQPERRPQGHWRLGWHVILPLILNLTWALVVLAGIAKLSLPDLLLGAPDLASALLASSVVALVWAVVRTVLAYGTLRKPIVPRSVIVVAKA